MTQEQNFGNGSIWKLIAKMGIPAVISMIVVVIYRTYPVGNRGNGKYDCFCRQLYPLDCYWSCIYHFQ